MSNSKFSIEQLEERHEMKFCIRVPRLVKKCRRILWVKICWYVVRFYRICF